MTPAQLQDLQEAAKQSHIVEKILGETTTEKRNGKLVTEWSRGDMALLGYCLMVLRNTASAVEADQLFTGA